jgi:hypothetical protein
MNIKEIIKAWAAALNPTEEQKEKAEKRLEICTSCENKIDTPIGLACGKCGCLFKGKVFSSDGGCPVGKW